MNNGFGRIIKVFVLLLVVSILLIFLNRFGYLNKFGGSISFMSRPVFATFQSYSNKLAEVLKMISDIGSFKDENSRLRKENYEILQKLSVLEETERENEILRRQLDFSDKLCASGMCLDWMMAKVIGRSPNSYEKYLIIDIGSKKGVKPNQAVIFSGGVIIGKITEVFDSVSKVQLLASSESSLNVITETSRSNGVVKGKFSTGTRLEMINQNEELKDGELIMTSGLEEGIPKGLLVGRVRDIEESANKMFKEANAALFVDPNTVEEVFIAKTNGN